MSFSNSLFHFIIGHPENKQAKLMVNHLKRYEGDEFTTLCEVCMRALTELTKPSLLSCPFDWRYVIHHKSFSALGSTAEIQNCKLCQLLFEVVKQELNERYSTEDFLPALVKECHGEPSFAFHPWTENLDTEISPISTGIETVRYCAFDETNNASFQGVNYHGFYDGIRLSIERLAGGIVTLLGRQVATSPPDQLAKRWIDYCNTLHRKCPRIKKTSLPTRIIDVGTGKNGQSANVILRESLKRKACYVALSHCWGSRKPRLMLEDSTHKQLLQGIQYGDLEKNFQDAILVTRALGYQYLWIDTLCIIQEDVADWGKECPLMESYYSNAAVTIAAADAQDAYAGFLHTREPVEHCSSPILFRMSISSHAVVAQITNRPTYDPSARVLSTLSSRAWAFQERHLSPRILYFSAKKMFFECASSEQHESLQYPIVQHVLPRFASLSKEIRASSQQELAQCTEDFYSMVWQYCRCSLTKVEDRLTAFSAIARRYHKRTGDRYLAGIWENSIARGLTWERDKPKKVGEDFTQGQTAPSWSWAACRARIELWHVSDLLITLESSYIRPKTPDLFGEIDLGVLKVTGSLMEARLKHDMENNYCYLHYTASYNGWEWEMGVALCACDDRDRCAAKCTEGEDGAGEHEERVTCLFLSTAMAHFNHSWCCLILEHYHNEPEWFRRIGLASKRPEQMDSIDWAHLPNRKTIHLV